MGLKRAWTRGGVRVDMSLFMKALAINIKRFVSNALEEAKNTFYRYQHTGIIIIYSDREGLFSPIALSQAA